MYSKHKFLNDIAVKRLDTIKEFCSKAPATLTVMDGSEHWFHTKEQMEFLDEWIGNK